jgi:hypothetical protein
VIGALEAKMLRVLFCLAFVGSMSAQAQTRSDVAVPPALVPWVPFLLDDTPGHGCPSVKDTGVESCLWAGVLNLRAQKTGLTFDVAVDNLSVRAEAIALPGDKDAWPDDVTVDGNAGVIVADNGAPKLRIAPGKHRPRGDRVGHISGVDRRAVDVCAAVGHARRQTVVVATAGRHAAFF